MLFNGLGVLAMLPFLNYYEKLLHFIVPSPKNTGEQHSELVLQKQK